MSQGGCYYSNNERTGNVGERLGKGERIYQAVSEIRVEHTSRN